jgi:glucose-1-phosphate adenylyltransferase
LTQFLSVSLHRHIGNAYKFDPFGKGFVEVLAAQQTNEAADWYQGTADAVRQNMRYIQEDGCRDVLILSGDQIYRMDFRHLLRTHRDNQAAVTIALIPVTAEQASGFGIVRLDDAGRVVSFIEKPKTEAELEPWRMPSEWLETRGVRGPAATGRQFLASMGIYLFQREVLISLLDAPPRATDFGKEVFPRSIGSYRVQAYLFDGYWEDVGTVKAYHEASLALTRDNPAFDFHSPEGVIYTRMRYLPAARLSDVHVDHSLISDGCVIQPGADIRRAIVGVRTQIGRNVTLKNSVIIGADRFQTQEERDDDRHRKIPPLGIGDNTFIDNAIVDKDCRVGANVRIVNQEKTQNGEGRNFVIRDGIVVIPKASIVEDGTVI